MRKGLARIWPRAISIVAVIACMVWFGRDLHWSELRDDVEHARAWPLLLAAAINFALLFGKAVSWRIMLAPRYRVSLARLTRYTIVAFATSLLVPARGGELVRVWLLKRRDGVPTADVAAVAIAEKLLDGVTMLLLAAPLPWLLPALPRWVTVSIAICAAVALVAFAVLTILERRIEVTEHSGWFARFVGGMHVLRSGRRLFAVMVTLIAVWGADWLMIWLVGYSVGHTLTAAQCLLILFSLNLAIAAPSTPANVGTLQVGVVIATDLLGIPRTHGAAIGLLYQAVQIFPLLAAGLLLEWRLVLGKDATIALEPDKVVAPRE